MDQSLVRLRHISFAHPQHFVAPNKAYIPEGTDHDNWALGDFARPVALGGAGYRITRADLIASAIDPVRSAPSVVTTPPFETAMDTELMPTDTVARQQALCDDVWLKVGCRELDGSDNIVPGLNKANQIQYDEQTRQLATRGASPTYPTPQTVQYPSTVPG
jgi:hypothetical protein